MITQAQTSSGFLVECFGCGEWLPVKLSKNGRAYWICNACAIQVFLRGITQEKLEEEDFAFSIREESS